MHTKVTRPAQTNRRGVILLRTIVIVPLIIMLAGVSVPPVAARPSESPPLALDAANKITLPTGISDGTVLWGDYDNDGDLDILASGVNVENTGSTTIFVNNGSGSFMERSSGMEQIQFSSADWGDFNNDGYMDVLLTGQLRVEGGSTVVGFAGLYENVASGGGRTFSLKQTFPNIYQGSGTFGDYNNDGHPDILLTGYTDNGATFSHLYRNTGDFSGTVYAGTSISITALGASASAWGDYNRDGFMDFAISGKTDDNRPTTLVYRNSGSSSFTPISLVGLWGGTINFLDYNLDRYLDLIVTGNTGTNTSPDIHPKTILYQYFTTTPFFREVSSTTTGLPDLWTSSVSVGDYDNDGYPDLAMGGKTLTTLPNQVFRNDHNGHFSDINAGLPNGAGTILAWGDYDGDRSLDLSLTGIPVYDPESGKESFSTYIYPNVPASANPAPTTPIMEAACWNDANQRLTLIWRNADDPNATTNSLSYNIRVGTAENDQNTVSSSSDLSTGYHRLPVMGSNRATVPIGNLTPSAIRYSAIMRDLDPALNHYWSVQAVDASYVGSPFDNTPGRIINLDTVVAKEDSYTVFDNALNVPLNVNSNDSNDAGVSGPPAVYSYTIPAHGTLERDAFNPNLLIYNPTQPFDGYDSFYYYAVRTNSLYCTRTKVTIDVNQHNEAPTAINLSNTWVYDGALPGTLVGSLTTVDPDINQTFTYSLPSGAGPDNAAFKIIGDQLLTNITINFAAKSEYHILIRSTDQGNEFVEQAFTINVFNNRAPTDINLTPTTVMERQYPGTQVGTLSSTDPDVNDTIFLYSLVSCQGSSYDNSKFNILVNAQGTHLVTNDLFIYNDRSTYQVCIRSSDPGGLAYDEVFTITILPSTPSLTAGSTLPIQMSEDEVDSYGKADGFHLMLTAVDAGKDEQLTWSIFQPASHGTATADGVTITGQQKEIFYKPEENWNSADTRGDDSFIVRVSDLGQHYADLLVTVTVKAVNDPPAFDAVDDIVFVERSGTQLVTITGIQSGPLDENGQKVTLAMRCQFNDPCTPPLFNLPSTSTASNGTGTLSVTIGAGTGTYTIVVAAYDGQSFNNTFSHSFKMTVVPGFQSYLPVVQN